MTTVLMDQACEITVQRFANALRDRRSARLEDFLPPDDHPDYDEILRELIRAEMDHAWSNGRGTLLESYRGRFPRLGDDPETLALLAGAKYQYRRDAGDEPQAKEYEVRYGIDVTGNSAGVGEEPLFFRTQDLRGQFPLCPGAIKGVGASSATEDIATRVVSVAAPKGVEMLPSADSELKAEIKGALVTFPEVGSQFVGFRLVQELGRGGFGVVFLAEQIDLADRLVALKVSVDLRGESQRLAQLQHTNIMPIYSEHRTDKLHAVCMPYFGSTTLADICVALRNAGGLPKSGKHLVSTLHNRQSTVQSGWASHSQPQPSVENTPIEAIEVLASKLPPQVISDTLLTGLENMTYENAILWLGIRLAAGLSHAHERGIIHRDLKPANILLADEGQPLLLDFNLAEDTKQRSSAAVAKVGGTLPYMSPEQLQSFADNVTPLDARTDLYSLGLILYQLLTGKFPFPVYKGRAHDILFKMIQDRRSALPELRTHNSTVSLGLEAIIQHCLQPNPDQRYQSATHLLEDMERQQKDLPLKHIPEPTLGERLKKWMRRNPKLIAPPVLAAGVAAVALLITLVVMTLSYQAKERALNHHREVAIERYRDFEQRFQRTEYLLTEEDPEQVTAGISAAQEALSTYRVLEDGNWTDNPLVKHLPPHDRDRLQQEVGELAFLLSQAVTNQQKPVSGESGEASARRYHDLAALNLGEQEQLVLAVQKSELDGHNTTEEYRNLRIKLQGAENLPGRSPYLLACDQVAHGRYQDAVKLLKATVEKNPDDFGSWYLLARCHAVLGQPQEALACYGICIALRPKFARPYHSRACMLYTNRMNLTQAKADLDQALRLQPNLLVGYIDRAVVLMALGRHAEALVDLDWALNCPDVPKRVYFTRAQARTALRDKKGAAEDLAAGLKQEPTDALSWVARGIARADTDPQGALADFVQAEKLQPRSPDVLLNLACHLGENLQKTTAAIEVLDRFLERFPDSSLGLIARAVYAARLGKTEEALTSLKKCLTLPLHSSLKYRVACVYAILSEKNPEYRQDSLHWLADALKHGWGYEYLKGDQDLNLLRNQEDFKKFLKLAETLQEWSKVDTKK